MVLRSCFLISSLTVVAMLSSLMMDLYNWMFSCHVAALAAMAFMGTGSGCWELEGHTGSNEVFGKSHDQTKVSLATASACGGDGTCIGIDLLGQ